MQNSMGMKSIEAHTLPDHKNPGKALSALSSGLHKWLPRSLHSGLCLNVPKMPSRSSELEIPATPRRHGASLTKM